MKCRVFKWTIHCGSCTPDNFYQFDEDFRDAVCPKLIKYVGVDVMNDSKLVDSDEFDPLGRAEFWAIIPVEHYNDADFDEIEQAVESAADDLLGGWDFEELKQEDIF